MFTRPGKHHVILLLLLVLLFHACVSSRQIATDFVVEETDLHVLLLPPPELIKTYMPGHPDDLPADSAFGPDHERARFVSVVLDSAFVDHFMRSIRGYLDVLYVNHYGPDEADDFFELDEPAYVFAVGQMELLEYLGRTNFVGYADGYRHEARVPITVLEANVWFEFMKVHDEEQDMQVLFDVRSTSDYVEGRFVRDSSGSVRFEPSAYPLSIDDVYDLAAYSGKRNAQNIFDHLLNLHVQSVMEEEPEYYFHYDVDEHRLTERSFPPFIEIKPGEENNSSEEQAP